MLRGTGQLLNFPSGFDFHLERMWPHRGDKLYPEPEGGQPAAPSVLMAQGEPVQSRHQQQHYRDVHTAHRSLLGCSLSHPGTQDKPSQLPPLQYLCCKIQAQIPTLWVATSVSRHKHTWAKSHPLFLLAVQHKCRLCSSSEALSTDRAAEPQPTSVLCRALSAHALPAYWAQHRLTSVWFLCAQSPMLPFILAVSLWARGI